MSYLERLHEEWEVPAHLEPETEEEAMHDLLFLEGMKEAAEQIRRAEEEQRLKPAA